MIAICCLNTAVGQGTTGPVVTDGTTEVGGTMTTEVSEGANTGTTGAAEVNTGTTGAPEIFTGTTGAPEVNTGTTGAPEVNTGTTGAPEVNTGTTGAPEVNTGTTGALEENTGTTGAPEIFTGTTGAPEVNTGTTGAPEVNTGTTGAPEVNTGTTGAPIVNTGTTAAPEIFTGTTGAPIFNTGTTGAPEVNTGTSASTAGGSSPMTTAAVSTPPMPPTPGHAKWTINCDKNLKRCTYNLHIPANDPKMLDEISNNITAENATLQQYNANFLDLTNQVNQTEWDVTGLINQLNATKINLTNYVIALKMKMDKIKSDLNDIQNYTDDTVSFIHQINDTSVCYSQQCGSGLPATRTTILTTYAPTTPAASGGPVNTELTAAGTFTSTPAAATGGGITAAATTSGAISSTSSTTTRPAGTTTPDPCAAVTCAYNGTCEAIGIPGQRTALCNCPGNLDGSKLCLTGGCVPTSAGGMPITTKGPFWSPNYNGTYGTYTTGLDCEWILTAPENMKIFLNATYFNMRPNSDVLTIKNDSGQLDLNAGTYLLDELNRQIARILNNSPILTLTLTTTSDGTALTPSNYFTLDYDFVT
uniref:CUB domain-containing protein n=1 Tax=Plectus sambesii TaxID=2011161 RepID=A0A914VWK1_9BILA